MKFMSMAHREENNIFAGALQKKTRTWVDFKETTTTYISIERLRTVKFGNKIHCFARAFVEKKEAAKRKMTG